jgi:1,4-dihydroxy-2-naphthoate polyprenyltransferase
MQTASSRFWKGLLQLADPKIWTASLVPFTLGASIAAAQGYSPKWLIIAMSVIVLILVEIGKNGVNEYFDYRSGADLYVSEADRTPFSGGKKVIVDGLLTLKQVRWISIVCLSAALFLAVPILWKNPEVGLFGVIGFFLAVGYSIPPLHFSYRGWGEAAVGLAFGPVIVNGAYFLIAYKIAKEPLLLSIPLAFLIANVLWINEVPDVEADRRAHKWNLVARLGRQRALPVYISLFVFAALSIVLSAVCLQRTRYLIALFGMTPALPAIRQAKLYILDTQKLKRANGLTILTYLLTGLLLAGASLADPF